MINLNRRAALLTLVAAISPLPAIATEKLPVVASFSILGDMTARIAGDRIELKTLVGPDGDGHVYQPTPADARAVAGARLVIVNGLAFEGWIPRLLQSSGTKAMIVEATKGVTPHEMKEGDDHDHDHDHGAFDPHAWQAVPNAKLYASNIRDALIIADPAGKEVYTANAAAYLAQLDALDAEIRALVTTIPAERRKIITSHDAFGYFAEAYGLTFVAPQGVSTEAEVSAKGVARIIRQIKKEKAQAVFMENISDPRLIKRIADETGARIGGTLYSDALSDDKGPAATYIDMMRHNARELAAALSS